MNDRPASAAGSTLAVTSTLVAVVALWLGFVTTIVLPARDPAHVPFWRIVALACLASALLATAALARPAARGRRVALGLASLVAIAAGVGGPLAMLRAGPGHFEGYVLVMGAILCAHGASGLAWLRTGERPRSARA